MMDKKIVFLDIDGTLVESLGKPSKKTVESVRRARKNGHKMVICTGRNMPIIDKDILDIGFDGIIASAGAHVEAMGKVIFDDLMSEETVQRCLRIFHENNVFCRIESEDGIFIDKEMEELIAGSDKKGSNSELERMQQELESNLNILRYDEYKHTGAYKICFTCTDLVNLEPVKNQLEDEFTFVVHAFAGYNSIYNGEIIRKGLDKGDGMKRICEYYGYNLSDTIAFGDSMNDEQMMRCADVAVAMGNACEELKAISDMVCESVSNEGITDGFTKLQLIK